MTITMPPQAQRALAALESAGYEAYIVGGCVRDELMGRTPGDYDITTSALPEQVEQCFAGERTVPTGIKHGTVTLVLDGMPLEITTYRADGEYTDHRRPDSVSFSTKLGDDLCRRDFTINAMAFSPRRGLVDMYEGRQDIARRTVRCVGAPDRRFDEDALRMLRAVRFAAVLDFDIDRDTLNALINRTGDISYVARERVFAELNKAVLAHHPQKAFRAGKRLVLAALEMPDSLPEYDDAIETMPLLPADAALRWAALLSGTGADGAKAALTELRAPNSIIGRTCAAIANRTRNVKPEREKVLDALSELGEECLTDALTLAAAQATHAGDAARADALTQSVTLAHKLVGENACFTVRQLAIGGNDLRSLGFSGRAIGETLNALLIDVIHSRISNEREALLSRVSALLK